MIKVLAKAIFTKDVVVYEEREEKGNTNVDDLYRELRRLVNLGKINEAGSLLFENTETRDLRYLEVALDFYNSLKELDAEYLEAYDYSREEIAEGLKGIAGLFGVDMGE